MELFDALRDIEKQYPGLDGLDLRNAFDTEVEYEAGALIGRNPYARAVEITHRRMLGWLEHAEEYRVELTLSRLAHFVATHRTACVWAVLARKSLEPVSE